MSICRVRFSRGSLAPEAIRLAHRCRFCGTVLSDCYARGFPRKVSITSLREAPLPIRATVGSVGGFFANRPRTKLPKLRIQHSDDSHLSITASHLAAVGIITLKFYIDFAFRPSSLCQGRLTPASMGMRQEAAGLRRGLFTFL